MKKNGKFLSAFAAAAVLMFSFGLCTQAAQIDSASLEDGVLDAYVTGISEEDGTSAKLYAAEKDTDGVVSVVNSCLISDGKAEGTLSCSDGKIYVWEDALLPLMLPYDLIDGRLYAENSEICVPERGVVIVSEIDDKTLKGYKEGNAVSYSLAANPKVIGKAQDLADIKPGSVVSLLFDREGNAASIELLTLLGGESSTDETLLEASCGECAAADGSVRYVNVIGLYYSVSLNNMSVKFVGDDFEDGEETHKYTFESSAKKSVVHLSEDGAVEFVETDTDWSGLEKIDSSNSVYVYLRYDTVNEVVKEAVFYYFPEEADITDGGEYSEVY